MNKINSKNIYVIGAGPIGLVIANELLKYGHKVKIFEKNKISGGMCRTWKWKQYLLDTGPHIFHTPNPTMSEYWEKNFNDLFIKGDFWCQNVKGQKFDEYWDYPLSWESISKYPRYIKSKIIKELDNLDLDKRAKATNYSDYIETFVGPTLKKMFFETYPEKIWGIKTKNITHEWAPKRIEFRDKIKPFYNKQWNAVGKYGTGSIYKRIEESIYKHSGEILFNKTLTKIDKKNNKITSLRFNDNTNVKINPQDIVISSLPINLTSKLLGYQSKLKFRGIRSVYLAYNQKQIIKGRNHWLYYGSEKIYFNRITEPKKLSKWVSPDKTSYLTAEITFSKNDKIDKYNSKKLVDEIADQVEKVGLIKKNKLIAGTDNKEYFVYPLLYKGYQEELAITKAKISKFNQLYSIGTGGEYNYADSQIIFEKAFDTAKIISNKESKFTQELRTYNSNKLNKIVSINDRKIGDDNNCYTIAEIGINHNGNLNLAKELIKKAKKIGVNAVKIQSFSAKKRLSKKVKDSNYAEQVIGTEESLFQIFDKVSLSSKDHKILFEYANEMGIELFSTPFDMESVDLLEKFNVNLYKIASMDLVNLPLIKYVGETKKPLIISTGMSNIGQIDEAIECFKSTGNNNLILLHCNSSYPSAPDEMNLNAIKSLKNYYNIPIGLSDHTIGLLASQIAITLGANVIERHFTLDRTFEGPDHILSSEPLEMEKLVSLTKQIPKIIGSGNKQIQPSEFQTLNQQRKSLYAKINIKKGQVINNNMIDIKGPGGGLLPKYLDIVVGRKASKNIEKDTPINWNNI